MKRKQESKKAIDTTVMELSELRTQNHLFDHYNKCR